MVKKKMIVYSAFHEKIGGVETWNYNYCKRMSKLYDIKFYYEHGDKDRLKEMEEYVEVIQFTGQLLEANKIVFSSAWGNRRKLQEANIVADKCIQVIHADYLYYKDHMNFMYYPMACIDEHVSVSHHVAKQLKAAYGIDSTVIYNMLDLDAKPDKVLKLITMSRISVEKGFDRLILMAKALKEYGRPFLWFVYGDINSAYAKQVIDKLQYIPEVIFMGVKYNLTSQIADCDYGVQLSDSEGYCYSNYETLQQITPIIVTDYPSALEQVTDGVNGYVLKMDMSNLDIPKLYDNIPNKFKFTENSNEGDWVRLLEKPNKKKKKSALVWIRATREYFDMQLDRVVKADERIQVSEVRASVLVQNKVGALL